MSAASCSEPELTCPPLYSLSHVALVPLPICEYGPSGDGNGKPRRWWDAFTVGAWLGAGRGTVGEAHEQGGGMDCPCIPFPCPAPALGQFRLYCG